MTKTILSLVAAATLALTLQACGGSDRPSKDELVDRIEKLDVLKGDQADCLAEALLDSDLSDEELRAIADDDQGDLSDDNAAKVGTVIGEEAAKCAS